MFWCFSLVLEAYISNSLPVSLHAQSNSSEPKKTCPNGEKKNIMPTQVPRKKISYLKSNGPPLRNHLNLKGKNAVCVYEIS